MISVKNWFSNVQYDNNIYAKYRNISIDTLNYIRFIDRAFLKIELSNQPKICRKIQIATFR